MRRTWVGDNQRHGGSSWLPFSWQSIPVTRGLLIAVAVTFLAYFFTGQQSGPIWEWVVFRPDQWLTRPWTWVTYAFLEMPSFWIIFTVLVIYSIGGSLERSWGSLNYLVLFLASSAIGALAFVAPYYLMQKPVLQAGLTLPLLGIVTAWAALDPDLEVSYWGLPVRAKTVAALFIALVYFQLGMAYRDPMLALFCLATPIAAYVYVRKLPRLNLSAPRLARARRTPMPRLLREDLDDGLPSRERVPRSSMNPLRRRQEQLEIERLRKLLGEDEARH